MLGLLALRLRLQVRSPGLLALQLILPLSFVIFSVFGKIIRLEV